MARLISITLLVLAMLFLVAPVHATMFKTRYVHQQQRQLGPSFFNHIAAKQEKESSSSVQIAPPSPSSSVYTELISVLDQQQEQQQVRANIQATPKYYINVYSNATSCSGNMTTYDLDRFAGNLGKCVDGENGLDSGVLQPCSVNPGGGSNFGYAFFSQPSCKGTVNTTLYAADTPTNNGGCFLVLVQTPTAHGTVAIQAQCPSV